MITIFNIAILLILTLPYSITYGGGYNEIDELTWEPNYVYENLELFIFFIPLSLLTIGFQVMKFNKWRKLLLGLHIVQCCAYSLNAFLSMGIPIQDYIPSWGQLVMVTLGPMTIIIWRIESIDFKKKKAANNAYT